MPINNLATTATTITTTTPTIKQEISLKRTISESVCDLEPRKRANISMEALTNSSPLTKLPQDELGQLCQKHIYNEQQSVRLYNVETNELLQKFDTDAAVLCCCFGEDNVIYFGGLDHRVIS
ncbi:hypothetical protein BD770DRAFT_444555 [Pilaira anomala]|nr:hypothetical protein BD770DRAFT_444555 [Pilaira anomala]